MDTTDPMLLFNQDKPATLHELAKALVEDYKTTSLAELVGPRRHKEVVDVRREFCYLAHIFYGRTLFRIGRYLGGRDHTTVYFHVRSIEDGLAGTMPAPKHVRRGIEHTLSRLVVPRVPYLPEYGAERVGTRKRRGLSVGVPSLLVPESVARLEETRPKSRRHECERGADQNRLSVSPRGSDEEDRLLAALRGAFAG